MGLLAELNGNTLGLCIDGKYFETIKIGDEFYLNIQIGDHEYKQVEYKGFRTKKLPEFIEANKLNDEWLQIRKKKIIGRKRKRSQNKKLKIINENDLKNGDFQGENGKKN